MLLGRLAAPLLLAAATLAGVPACSQHVEGPSLVLTLATADLETDPTGLQIQRFVAEVSRLSAGSIVIKPTWDVDEGAPNWDQVAARAVGDGTYDLGLVPGRAWDSLGVTSLDALNTPFLVTSDELLRDILGSGLREDLLSGLPDAGVVGLDLFPDELRHPFGYSKPLRGLDDYEGQEIRTPTSAAVTAMFGSFGATTVDDQPFGKEQRGVESSYGLSPAGIATGNVTFFAKTNVLVANETLRAGIRDDQWSVLEQAAQSTREWLLQNVPSDLEAATTFCLHGGKIVAASTAQLAQLEQATAPVVAQLRTDPLTSRLIDDIQTLKSKVPDPTPSTQCAGVRHGSSVLDGRYVAQVSMAELRSAGVTNDGLIRENSGHFQWTLDDGTWAYHQTAHHFIGQPDSSGFFTYKRGILTIHWTTDSDDFTTATLHVEHDGTLTFDDVEDGSESADPHLSQGFFTAAWDRVGPIVASPGSDLGD